MVESARNSLINGFQTQKSTLVTVRGELERYSREVEGIDFSHVVWLRTTSITHPEQSIPE